MRKLSDALYTFIQLSLNCRYNHVIVGKQTLNTIISCNIQYFSHNYIVILLVLQYTKHLELNAM